MTQEEKQLLLQDLCARLPYGVKLKHIPSSEDTVLEMIGYGVIDGDIHDLVENFRPYLRSISSMTEEEKEERASIVMVVYNGEVIDDDFINVVHYIDWLNAHHFDFRNLIERGLAIEVTEDNNPYK